MIKNNIITCNGISGISCSEIPDPEVSYNNVWNNAGLDYDGCGAGTYTFYDIGAYECFPACEGDFNRDGDVDGSGLALFAADFGRTDCDTGEECEGDFDKDGDTDGSDLAVFAADFGRTDCE